MENVPCAHEKNLHSAFVGKNVLLMSVESGWFMLLLTSCVVVP